VNSLLTFIPEDDTMAQIVEHIKGENEITTLSPPDQFAYFLSQVPHLKERLQCFKYMMDFEPKKGDLKPDITTLLNCSLFIANDKKLEQILHIVLHVGNFLNAGNSRLGSAMGFSLETLSKLHDTKTTDNKSTVFEVIVEMIKDENNSLLLFSKSELDLVESGARVSLQTLEAEVRKLRKDYDQMSKTAAGIELVGEADLFQSKFTTFLDTAKSDLEVLEKEFTEAQSKYEDLVKLWQEDPKKIGPEEFFTTWKTFTSKIVETSEAIDAEKEKADKLRKREEAKKKREEELATKSSSPTSEEGASESGTGGGGRGRGGGGAIRGRGGFAGRGRGGMADDTKAKALVDDLFAKMQSGNVFREKKN